MVEKLPLVASCQRPLRVSRVQHAARDEEKIKQHPQVGLLWQRLCGMLQVVFIFRPKNAPKDEEMGRPATLLLIDFPQRRLRVQRQQVYGGLFLQGVFLVVPAEGTRRQACLEYSPQFPRLSSLAHFRFAPKRSDSYGCTNRLPGTAGTSPASKKISLEAPLSP